MDREKFKALWSAGVYRRVKCCFLIKIYLTFSQMFVAGHHLSPERSRAGSVYCRWVLCNWQGGGKDGFVFPKLRVRRKDMLHVITHILSLQRKRHEVRRRLLPFLWSTSVTSLGQLATISGLVFTWWELRIKLMMAAQYFSFFPSSRETCWVNCHFFGMEKRLFRLVIVSSALKKKSPPFPLVSIFFRYSITRLFRGLQEGIVVLWYHHIMEETSKIQ